jgi:hypothetical protein
MHTHAERKKHAEEHVDPMRLSTHLTASTLSTGEGKKTARTLDLEKKVARVRKTVDNAPFIS